VASLLNQRHHYDLTPVMRNTTSSGGAADPRTKGNLSGRLPARNDRSLVSPETEDEENPEFLHGEHLSLPADLSIADTDGPILPSLRKSTTISAVPPPHRPQRAQSLTAHHLSFHELNQGTTTDSACHEHTVLEPSDGQPHQAVQFPARRFYSFTSREQYQKLASGNAPAYDEDLSEEESSLEERPGADRHPHNRPHHLRPYQPSRHDFEEIEESLPPEALEAIFIERRRRNSLRSGGGGTANTTNNANNNAGTAATVGQILRETETDESSQKHHRLLENPIPMEERQWSIPSLHMAQRLATDGGSLASLTDHGDDESLLYVSRNGDGYYEEDEASITSRASSLYMSIGGSALETLQSSTDVVPIPRIHLLQERQESNTLSEHTPTIWNDDNSSSINRSGTASSSFEGIPSFGSYGGPESSTRVVLESSSSWNQLLSSSTNNQQPSSDENSAVAVDGERALRRKRKQRQREEAALDWLHSLQQQSQQPPVVEAASSKFLTGRSGSTTAVEDDATTTAFAIITETSKLET
jgi:hypothetical protein